MPAFPKTIPITGRVRVCVELLRRQQLKGKTIVDVGSTFGWLAREIQPDAPKKYIGVEPNPEAVAFSKKHNPKVTFKVGTAGELPVEDGIADIAVFFDVIEHIPVNTEVEALKEINRVLKKGGVLLLTTPFDHPITKITDPAWYFGHRHYSKKLMRSLMNKAGFTVDEIFTRGTLVNLIYMLFFYFSKWILRRKSPPAFFTRIDDAQYNNEGIATLCVRAIKK